MRRALAYLHCGAWPLVGLVLAGFLGAGCSSKSATDPTPVTVDELKYPGDLVLFDKGAGKLTLQWSASNNESDFYGFNVYGTKASAPNVVAATSTTPAQYTHPELSSGSITVTEGQAITLLNSDESSNTDAKAVLAKFDYDPTKATPLEAAGTPPSTGTTNDASSGATPAFTARPISTLDSSGNGIYPTCQVSGQTCTMTTSSGEGNTNTANGAISFDLSSAGTGSTSTLLAIGETYCFFVMSTMAKGQQVSATSSNVQCVVPSYFQSFDLTLPKINSATAVSSLKFDLLSWLKTCTGTSCPDPTSASNKYIAIDDGVSADTISGSHSSGSDPAAVYIETIGSGGPSFNAGENTGVLDLGYYAGGLSDPLLPQTAPAITLASSNTNFTTGGYSTPGQSVPILPNHVYVVAIQDSSSTSKFYYDWIFVNSSTVTADSSVTLATKIPAASK